MIPGILDDWEEWKSYLEECSKEDFYKILKTLNDRVKQAQQIASQREKKDPKKPMTYKTDNHATDNYIPYVD